MTDLLLARFWIRSAGQVLSPRGAVYACLEAEGKQMVNGIGSGRVAVPHYEHERRAVGDRAIPGDVCVAYSIAPGGTPQHIATFLVEAVAYRGGMIEMSGPDFIGELDEYVAIAPVGELSTVSTTASSMGSYLDRTPEPDVWVPLEAAYPARGYFTQDVTAAGKPNILFTEHMAVQVTDAFLYTFPDGQIFQTTVTGVSDERTRVEIETPLPQTLPGGSKVTFLSTRIRVQDGSIFEEGGTVYYTPSAWGNAAPKPTGNIVIDRIERGEGDAPDYLYSADPIADHITTGTALTQQQYIQPTTDDVNQLLTTSTFGEWSVLRGPLTVNGSAYAPTGETVFDVLLAITDITGYQFRRYFRGWDTLGAVTFPLRRIEYFKPGSPPVTGEVLTLETDNRIGANYGELFNLEVGQATKAINHLIPYGGGGGSGRFDFRAADIGTVLGYYPAIGWGIVSGQYYIYLKEVEPYRAVWHEERFSQISPVNPADFQSRRDAANMLLAAACQYLIANSTNDTIYSADVFTLGEPLPGDVINLKYEGVEPTAITGSVLIITEVHHTFDAAAGYRVTRLVMNKSGVRMLTGPLAIAQTALGLQRMVRHSNFGSRGDARITYDEMEFGGDGDILSRTGDLFFRSETGDVSVLAPTGEVTIGGRTINLSGTTQVNGTFMTREIVLQDSSQPVDYDIEAFTLRGIPRLRVHRRARVNN